MDPRTTKKKKEAEESFCPKKATRRGQPVGRKKFLQGQGSSSEEGSSTQTRPGIRENFPEKY